MNKPLKNQPQPGGIDQKHAETLARLFNIAYNGAVLYGGSHQTTVDSAVPLCNFLSRFLSGESMVSLIVERDSVYLENFCVDRIINSRRLVLHFKKVGLQSVTFSNEVSVESVRAFLAIMSDMQAYATVDAMQRGLALRSARGIRLNYVVYRKMTTDEKVVNKNAALSLGQTPLDTSVARQVLSGLSDVVAAGQLVDGAEADSPKAPSAAAASAEANLPALLNQLRAINARVTGPAGTAGETMSIQEIVESVVKLKREVNDNLDVIRTTHKLNESDNLVIGELDAMSHDVMLRLLCEEYKGGGVSTRRLAQIARRMLPDIKDLKRMLPRLKDALTKEGMPQADYLQFVTDILKDIESDGLAGVFEPAVREMGVSMDELVEAIRADPSDAARLIVLASELRKSARGDDAQLSSLLTDYIERVSRSLSLESKDVAKKEGIGLLQSTIGRIEADLLERLKHQGVAPGVLDQASALLQARLDGTVNDAKQEWASRFVSSLRDLDENELLNVLKDLGARDIDAALLREPFGRLLREKGRSDEQISRFFEKAAAEGDSQRQELPKGVLNVNATLYFLEREIKRHQRYNTPFSSILVTVERVKTGQGEERAPLDAEPGALMPQVLLHLRRVLRDLDIVGSLGLVSGDVPFVVLPMTDGAGAAKVVERLRRELNNMVFDCGGAELKALFVISHSFFDKSTMTGYRSFLEHALTHHRKQEPQAPAKP
jgi:hypothetical protein